MPKTIFAAVEDGQDGSASISFFDADYAEQLEDHNPETWGLNEGSFTPITVDGDFTNIEVKTQEDVTNILNGEY